MSEEIEEQEGYKPEASMIEKNFKWIVTLVIIGLLAGGGNAFYKSQVRKKEREAFTQLYQFQKDYLKKKEEFQKEAFADFQNKDKKDTTKTEKKKTGDITKDFGDTVQKLKGFISANQGSQASAQAAFYLYEIHKDYNKLEDVIEPIQQAYKGIEKGLTRDLLKMTLANAMAESKKCDEAVTHYQELLVGKTIKYLKGEAGVRAGLCLESLKQVDRARDMYQKAIDADPESQIAKTAEKYLRVLKAQGQSSGQPQKGQG